MTISVEFLLDCYTVLGQRFEALAADVGMTTQELAGCKTSASMTTDQWERLQRIRDIENVLNQNAKILGLVQGVDYVQII